jgi:hypothetical protein
MNVYEYFLHHLNVRPSDDTLQELPVETSCGRDCRQAIDAAKALIVITDKADPHLKTLIVDATDGCVTTFLRG